MKHSDDKEFQETLLLKIKKLKLSKVGLGYSHVFLKLCLGIVTSALLSIIPVLSGQTLSIVTLNALSVIEQGNIYGVVQCGVSILFIIALFVPILRGFELASLAAVVTTLFISVVSAYFIETAPGTGSSILLVCIGLVLAWLGEAITAICMVFTYSVGKKLGVLSTLTALGLTSTLYTWVLMNLPPKSSYVQSLITLPTSIAIIIAGAIIAQQAVVGSPKFAWLREKVVFWAAIGGTSFYGIDLTDICFDSADLRYTDFRNTTLTRASFEGAIGLDLARLQGTILEQPKVRKLLITKRGYNEDYTASNFNGASLKGADLTQANLTEVQALDADFTEAILTDACIQGWNINKNTCFKGVVCKRIFLKGTKKGDRLILSEQKPDSGEFKPGEFEKWISEIQNTVDLIFREGLNWRAFIFSLAQTAIEHEQLDLSRYSITRKDENLVFAKIGTLPGADNAAIHQAFQSNYEYAEKAIEAKYQLVLQAKDNEIERFRTFAVENQQILRELMSIAVGTGRQVLVQGEGHRVYMLNQTEGEVEIMESKKETNVGGDVFGGNKGNNVSIGSVGRDMTLTGSSLAGDLNQVSNTIQQLRDVNTSSGDELAKILTALKDSIAQDQVLSESQKKEALEAVETLAEEGKKPPEERGLKLCSMAVNALRGITSTVTDMSQLAEIFSTHLPALTGLLGL